MHAREKQVASQRQLGIKSINRAPFVTHPSLVLLRIDNPKREIGRFRSEIDSRIALAQRLLPTLALDRNTGNVRGHFGQPSFLSVWSALLLSIHGERTQDVALR